MRCLIIGGDGMLGSQLLCSWQARHTVKVTLRRDLSCYRQYGLYNEDNAVGGVDALDTDKLLEVLGEFRPDAVVNAAGIIKQRSAAKESIPSLEVNALFPHRLRLMCQSAGARMVHISTDCVFNGRRGAYTEQDHADAEDIYGLTKYLGEVSEAPAVTLRTSIIGLELSRKQSLIEWFLRQHGTIRGFTRAIYSGVTVAELARVIEMVFQNQPDLSGLWQVASTPISKYDLLVKLAARLGRGNVTIVPDDTFVCDRSLNGIAFARKTGYSCPSWDEMLEELADQIEKKGFFHDAG